MFNAETIRKEFPILDTCIYGKPLVYLDSGATAQKPRRVIDKINSLHTSCNANIHRGAHYMSNACTSEYEEARERIRAFIHAPNVRNIVFTSGATASINLVAASYGEAFIRKGDEIIVSQMEHHSNIVPWQLLCQRTGAVLKMLPFNEEGAIEMERYEQLLSEKTRIVAITQASNVLGTMPPLRKIIDLAHAAKAVVLVDGCQGIVHAPVNVEELDCDFYVFSGHKLYGPTGTGVLYAKEKWLEAMPPYMGGGDMVGRVSFERTTYAELPLKFEAGTTNYIGMIGLGEAIAFLNTLDLPSVHAHERRLLAYASERLNAIDGLRIYGTVPGKCSIVSFNVEGLHPLDVGMILDKTGVAVRTGTHCAEPVMARYGITSMVRASFALYNTIEEIDALGKSVELAIQMLR